MWYVIHAFIISELLHLYLPNQALYFPVFRSVVHSRTVIPTYMYD